MPELPEVETVCRGLRDLISPDDPIREIQLVRRDLREPVPLDLPQKFRGQCVAKIVRRAKFILFETNNGILVSHLGMSGTWRSFNGVSKKHDHIHIHFQSGQQMTYNDPRRFGLFFAVDPQRGELPKWLRHLGCEPLEESFNLGYLQRQAVQRQIPIKNFLMDQKVVVGIGNIYASEILFMAGVLPTRMTKRIQDSEWHRILRATRKVLQSAIESRGTTLRDYKQFSTEAGGFQNLLAVYGRNGENCFKCKSKIRHKTMGGRSTYWCRQCQK